jgi:hypothetical protein
MIHRRVTWLAWSVWLVVVISGATYLFLSIKNDKGGAFVAVITVLIYIAFSTVGALVVSHQPHNAVG